MKKYLLSLIALLFLCGVSFAAAIPDSMEPQTGGPELWFLDVYNNGSTTLDAGDVVIWDGDSSTGDNDNWVTTTTTADTYLVAGVVYPDDIVASGSGTIVIRGPVPVDTIAAHLNIVKGLACSSSTAGSARSCTTDNANFGIVVTASGTGNATVCVHCNK